MLNILGDSKTSNYKNIENPSEPEWLKSIKEVTAHPDDLSKGNSPSLMLGMKGSTAITKNKCVV